MIDTINFLIQKIAVIITTVLNLLPDSPFRWEALEQGWIGALNYMFPIDGVIAHLELYVFAVAVYYALRIVLRWIRAAGG